MLKNKYLAYFILLAAWLCVCYWLYAKEIYPKLHPEEGFKWPVYDNDLALPLAFNWSSDIPIAGAGFDSLSKIIEEYRMSDSILIISGGYYLDEKEHKGLNKPLGLRRADRIVQFFQLDLRKTLIFSQKKEIDADVRALPFEAISFTLISKVSLMHMIGDTTEICFPVRDSILLPAIITEQLDQLVKVKKNDGNIQAYVIGTADGTGIAESSDVAVARAIVMRDILIKGGWTEDRIVMTTGQRSHSEPILNRCALVFFE